ncbi:MAG: sugar phosphate nucleotidyltransferase [Patescibacteria group bacterium]
MKGVILAGGKGTRLWPLTAIANKHLLPVYNKPMIIYPLETLKHLGVKDILIVSGGEHIGWFTEFLGDGSGFGVNLTYRVQREAGGIAQALSLAKEFTKEDNMAVILGDNIFDNNYIEIVKNKKKNEAVLYVKKVDDASLFGVIEIGKNGKLIGIEEKPKIPKSNIAVTGLYIYPPNVFEIISKLKPSSRNELEITDINNYYIKNKKCIYKEILGFWSDAGTFDSLLRSANWVKRNDNNFAN